MFPNYGLELITFFAIANLSLARKVEGLYNELILPIGFDARLIGNRVGEILLLFIFSTAFAAVLFAIATIIVGLLLCSKCWCCSWRKANLSKDDKRVQILPTNRGKVITKDDKRVQILPTNRGKVITKASAHDTIGIKRDSSREAKNEDGWHASGPPSYLMNDTKENSNVEKNRRNGLGTSSADPGSSTDDEFVDLDAAPARSPRSSNVRSSDTDSDADWDCQWCFKRNPFRNEQCSLCSRPSPHSAREQQRSNRASTSQSSLFQDQPIRTHIENRRPTEAAASREHLAGGDTNSIENSSSSSEEEEYVDMDESPSSPVKNPSPWSADFASRSTNNIDGDWECQWCFKRNPFRNEQCSLCSRLSPRSAREQQESNNVATRNASVHRDQTIRTATENHRPKPAPSEAASAEEEYVDLDESPSSRPTEYLAGNIIENSSSSSEEEEYVDMDESPSSPVKNPSPWSADFASRSTNNIDGDWECQWCFKRNPFRNGQCSLCSRLSPRSAREQQTHTPTPTVDSEDSAYAERNEYYEELDQDTTAYE